MDPNAFYRGHERHSRIREEGARAERAPDIPADATRAILRREKASHQGIAMRTGLHALLASAVDQAYLDEIGALQELRWLELGWPTCRRSKR